MKEKDCITLIAEGRKTKVRPGNLSESILMSEAAEVLRMELARQLWDIVRDSCKPETRDITPFRESIKQRLIALVNLNQE